jgi:hypothetical protein
MSSEVRGVKGVKGIRGVTEGMDLTGGAGILDSRLISVS